MAINLNSITKSNIFTISGRDYFGLEINRRRVGSSGFTRNAVGDVIKMIDTSYVNSKTTKIRVPGYNRSIADGWTDDAGYHQPVTSYSYDYYAGDQPLYFVKTQNILESEAHDKAENRLIDKISQLKQANLGVSLIESKQTISLIGDTAVRITDAFNHLRKGRFSKAYSRLGIAKRTKLPPKLVKRRGVKFARDLMSIQRKEYLSAKRRRDTARVAELASSAWLEIHFGWKPLLQDTYDVAKAVAYAESEKLPEHFVFKGTESVSCGVTPPYAHTDQSTGYSSATVSKVWRCTIDSVHSWITNKFGLSNPAVVFYEAVPFSFVLDWFVPVGQFLERAGVTKGLNFHSACDSIKYVADAVSVYDVDYKSGTNTIQRRSSTGHQIRSFRRDLRGVYYPRPSLPEIDFSALMDPWKLVTALALGTSLTRVR